MKFLFRSTLRFKLILGIMIYFISCSTKQENDSDNLAQPIMNIEQSNFGSSNGQAVSLYTLKNNNKMMVSITNYGGIVTSILVPDRDGIFGDVVLGFDNLADYLEGHPYFGSIVGRYGNRIAKGEFTIEGESYTLARNNGENHLHGGNSGFDKKIWQAETYSSKDEVGVILTYISEDMEEGYPGNLTSTITYALTNDNELKITYEATTDKACPVNLTHHGYFNLTAGKENVLNHQLKIYASKFVEVDEGLIPTGNLPGVANGNMDFLDFHAIGERIHQVDGGYDHSYVVDKKDGEFSLSVEVFEPNSGRLMEVYTTEPAVQFYTGNFLDGSLTGKNDIVYNQHFGFCLEAQHYPDSPNQPSFPNTILLPGEKYTQVTVYKFLVK